MGGKKRKIKILCLLMVFVHMFVCMSSSVFANEIALTPQEATAGQPAGTPETGLSLTAKSAVLMEPNTGKVLYEKNAHEKLPPASVTKIMTLLLIYDSVEDGRMKWDDMVTVSEHAASMGGSQVFLEPNEQQTVRDMTKCIAIASANDGAVAMAEHIAGSEAAFVEMMNQKAKELGMEDTCFINACGLDADGHVTSAYDIALMSRELTIKHPQVFEFTKTWQDSIVHHTKRGDDEFGLTNTNKLLKWYDGATGLKTGSTGKALYCLSGTAERNGLGLIGVVMAAPDYKVRFQEVMKLFDYGFANYAIQKGLPAGEAIGEVPVSKGEADIVNLVVAKEVTFLAKKGQEGELTKEIVLIPSLQAPVEAGIKGGEIIYKVNGEEVGRSDAITGEKVERVSLGTMLKRLLMKWK